jgi:hypothetical protein
VAFPGGDGASSHPIISTRSNASHDLPGAWAVLHHNKVNSNLAGVGQQTRPSASRALGASATWRAPQRGLYFGPRCFRGYSADCGGRTGGRVGAAPQTVGHAGRNVLTEDYLHPAPVDDSCAGWPVDGGISYRRRRRFVMTRSSNRWLLDLPADQESLTYLLCRFSYEVARLQVKNLPRCGLTRIRRS